MKIKKNFRETDKTKIEKFDYLSSNTLDSLELLKFHMSLEKKFKVRFSALDLTSKKIKTIGGISEIILKKLKK